MRPKVGSIKPVLADRHDVERGQSKEVKRSVKQKFYVHAPSRNTERTQRGYACRLGEKLQKLVY